MKSCLRKGHVWLVLILVIVCSSVGCQRVEQPGASTTTPAGVVERGGEPAKQPLQPKRPKLRKEEASAPAADQRDHASHGAPSVPAGIAKLVPVEIKLPAPAFRGTPVPLDEPNVEKPLGKPRQPFLAPEGTRNLARGKSVICSDAMPTGGEVDYVTDGDKEASDFGYLELRPGTEWVQVDLGQEATIYAVLLWHNHAEARVYRDVIIQVSDDPDFLDAQTLFNNDYDNSSGMGIGRDMGYVETAEGKLIDCLGVEARYVRLYSRGNHVDDKNHYTEVDVYGRPGA